MNKQPLNLPVADGVYELQEAWSYEWFDDLHREWKRICIPQGYRCDGASVPRSAWTLSGLTPDGLIRAAALVHDFIYEHKGRMPAGSFQYFHRPEGVDTWTDDVGTISRQEADSLFRQIMKESGISAYRRTLAYTAVSVFGRSAWNDND